MKIRRNQLIRFLMNFNLKWPLRLPIELHAPYIRMKQENKILASLSYFKFVDVAQQQNSFQLCFVTPFHLPIDSSFMEPYIYRYSVRVQQFNQLRSLEHQEFTLLYLFNAWVLSDLFLRRTVSLDNLEQYFDNQNSNQETFLFGLCNQDELDWDGMKQLIQFKQQLKHNLCLDASTIYEKIGDDISNYGCYFGSRNHLINYAIHKVIPNPQNVPAAYFFQLLVEHFKSFPDINAALEHYHLQMEEIQGISLEEFLLTRQFKAEQRKENILGFRKFVTESSISELELGGKAHIPNEPIALIGYTKHFKQCHSNNTLQVTFDYCANCDSPKTECSILNHINIRHPQVYLLSRLKLCPMDIKFVDFFNKVLPRFVDRLMQWIRAGSLKKQLQINTNLGLLRNALCIPSVHPMNNYECLEVLGDSALKFITSTSLFLLLNDRGEDAMTNYRTAMIRNSYLKVLPVASNISNFITTKMYYSKYFENFVNEKAIIDNQVEQQLVESQLSDIYEGILGAIFQSTFSFHEMCSFMRQTNFALPQQSYQGNIATFERLMKTSAIDLLYQENFFTESPCDQYPNLNQMKQYSQVGPIDIETFQNEVLQYKFVNINLLHEALSYPTKDSKYSYQRLEFLGDAALETLVISNIYNQIYPVYFSEAKMMPRRTSNNTKDQFICPGMLHQTKTLLLDNGFMSSFSLVNRFPQVMINLPEDQQLKAEILMKDLEELTDVTYKTIQNQNHLLPKCFGDVFESIAAAILLDGGQIIINMKRWPALFLVYGRFYKPYIKYICQNIEPIYEQYQKENFGNQLEKRLAKLNIEQ